MYDFLANFHKRMEKLSCSYLIDSKAATLSFFKEYLSDVEFLNIIYTLMVFILERSLKDEECTLSDMSAYLYDIIHLFYNDAITEEKVRELTHDIVYKILRNDGKPFVFSTIDYESGRKCDYSFHLVQQKTSQKDSNKSTFYLEREGYRLILNSLEVDEKTQIDINQMILELSLEKKNFNEGLVAVEKLNKLITVQIQIIRNYILKIRENIFAISGEDLENNYERNLGILKEQNQHFYELYDLITKEEERLGTVEMAELDKYASLKQLAKIKEILGDITGKATQLIGYHFQFKEEYAEALERFSAFYNNRRINIKEHLLKPLEHDAVKLGDIYRLFNPFFRKGNDKLFNPNIIFRNQDLYIRGEGETDQTIDETLSAVDDQRTQKDRMEYSTIVRCLLSHMIKKKDTSLKDLIESYNDKVDEEYRQLVPSVRKLEEVLIELLRLGEISIEDIINNEKQALITQEIAFDLRKILVNEITVYQRQTGLHKLIFFKETGSDTIEIRPRNVLGDQEPQLVEVLSCPNIIMKAR